VEQPEPFEKISIPQQAAQLTEPFTMIELVQIDDLAMSVFLCKGILPYHRHLDQDELFLVHSGTISLDSEWGPVILRPGELAVVPKGLGHRSSSPIGALVILLQPRLMANRRNGDRRLFALKNAGKLEKVNIPALSRGIAIPFQPVVLAHLDTFALFVMACEGTGPWLPAPRQSGLVFCYDGALDLESALGTVCLQNGELVVMPKGVPFRLCSATRATVIGLQRHKQPGLPLPD
jgi:homogentisate 1,2-dioxygenase